MLQYVFTNTNWLNPNRKTMVPIYSTPMCDK